MRLIDADALMKILEDKMFNSELMCPVIKILDVMSILEEQPTAYNVDAVVEEIKNVAVCNDECARTYCYGMGCEACAWNTIMDLVRKGGVNENNN